MPQKKYYSSRKKTSSKKRPSLPKLVKKEIYKHLETKEFYSNSLDNNTFDRDGRIVPLFAAGTAGTPYTYNIPYQGPGDNERIGDTVTLMALHLRLRTVYSGTVSSPDIMRVIIFRWKPYIAMDDNFLNLAPEVLYYNLGQDYFSCLSPQSNKHMERVILYDKTFKVHTYSAINHQNITIPLRNVKVEFTGNGSSNTHGCTNQLFLMVVGEGTPTNAYIWTARITYKDG